MAERIDQITEQQFDAAWAALIEEMRVPDIQPNEKTAQMLADETGLSRGSASNKLLSLEREGKLTSRMVHVPGKAKPEKAYRFRTDEHTRSQSATSRRVRVSEKQARTAEGTTVTMRTR